jgi:hypothetical protein
MLERGRFMIAKRVGAPVRIGVTGDRFLTSGLPCPLCGSAVALHPFVIDLDWPPVAAAWRGAEKEQ